MKTFLLVGHGGYYNRGCEAIVRSTVALLRERFGSIRVILSSFNPRDDRNAGFQLTDKIIPASCSRWSYPWMVGRFVQMVKRGEGVRWWLAPVNQSLKNVDAVLSIGGDNYCYGNANYFIHLDRLAHEAGKPVALWGASIDTYKGDERTIEDLRKLELITARESLTVEHLARKGITDNVKLVADPAFLLPSEPVNTEAFWPQGDKVLGFNVSPLLQRYSADQTSAPIIRSSIAALRHVIDDLHYGVLLIPHVTGVMAQKDAWNDDSTILALLQKSVDRPGKIALMPSNLNALQTKFIISKCQLFVGARTHSTIAGLSTNVPTLSIGYSIKARGINTDIFGDTRYVLDIGEITDKKLIGGIDRLFDEQQYIRNLLSTRIPAIKDMARLGADYVAELLR